MKYIIMFIVYLLCLFGAFYASAQLNPNVKSVRYTFQDTTTFSPTPAETLTVIANESDSLLYYKLDTLFWQPLGGGDDLTFDNGLIRTGDNVQLGGVLIKDTDITSTGGWLFSMDTDSDIQFRTTEDLKLTGDNGIDSQSGDAGILISDGLPIKIRKETATTNAVINTLDVNAGSTGTPANGIGSGITLTTETSVGNEEIGTTLNSVTTDVTGGSEDFSFVVNNMAAGAAASQVLSISSIGAVTFGGTTNSNLTLGRSATTGTLRTVYSDGSGANIGLTLGSKGTGNLNLDVTGGLSNVYSSTDATSRGIIFNPDNSAANEISFSPDASGSQSTASIGTPNNGAFGQNYTDNLTVQTGQSTSTSPAGDLSLTAGAALGSGDGGSLSLTVGASASGTPGSFSIVGSTTHGRATLVAGTVTVNNAIVAAGSNIYITSQVDGGTPGWLRISARVNGTSFTITSSSVADTSTVAWILINP